MCSTHAPLGIHIPDIRVPNQNCPHCSDVFTVRNELLMHLLLIHDTIDANEFVCDDSTVTSVSDGSKSGKRPQEELGGMQDMVQQDEVRSATTVIKRLRGITTGAQDPAGFARKHIVAKPSWRGTFSRTLAKGPSLVTTVTSILPTKRNNRIMFDMQILKRASREKPYECRYCDKAFARSRQRVQHELVEHDVGKKYNCSHCSETFNNNGSLWNHTKSHTENILRCDKCPYVAYYTVRMTRHKMTHSDEKPHSCDQCSSRFTSLGRLKIHMRSHTGEKPYACDQCEKAFVDSYSLKRHARTHTGEKPYKCNYCNMSFAQGCQRQFHERTHTGEKPYACSQCEKKFIRRQELNKHLETHKKGKQPAKKKRKLASKES
ncbi:hypothetical protein OS493_020937 [Desmophyllum pertusum]|uniref:C2H2-type domain-containing protein n=1 Tax=Desmophyllum pertusum TaxID=174260 RepID=A0A9X0A028_9CNID|nr:hypothetical protein OS493_020937 [Desmophyllum pertusum]